MKIKSFITILLLFVLGFSVFHSYIFTSHDESHSGVEYISGWEEPTSHGDICDIHFKYHQPFLLTDIVTLSELKPTSKKTHLTKESYTFYTTLKFLKPPIL